MSLKKKIKRTGKPENPYSAMFGFIGFTSQTYFNWASDASFNTIRNAKYKSDIND